MDNKEFAKACREMAEWIEERYAPDPPKPDYSHLRGWVLGTTTEGDESVWWANQYGVCGNKDDCACDHTWEEMQDDSTTFRSLYVVTPPPLKSWPLWADSWVVQEHIAWLSASKRPVAENPEKFGDSVGVVYRADMEERDRPTGTRRR